MKYTINSEWAGHTVRDFLRNCAGISGRMLSRIKKIDDGILINGERVTVRRKLCSGDILELSFEDREDDENPLLIPVELPIDIVYEDDDIIVLNKAPGMPTHPSHDHFEDSLANALAYYYKEKGRSFVFRAVNRLDADTSGLVLVAKTKDAAYKLSLELQRGEIKKEYIAFLSAIPDEPAGKIREYIRRKEESIILRCVCGKEEPGAMYAETDYRIIAVSDGICMATASPVTGRTHQLRVHFSHIGCPICGDDLYGCVGASEAQRHALHARTLELIHPVSGRRMKFCSPVSGVADLSGLVGRFGGISGDI